MQPVTGAIVGVGEVLWDLFPSGRQLGGAPFNFVFHCHQLGHPAVVVSRVGRDELGAEIRAALRGRNLTDAYLQEDAERPTGTVRVTVGEGGQPAFVITEGVAFDRLAPEPAWDSLFARAVAVGFGTLVQREPAGRSAIRHALGLARNALTVCDINLRQHYFDRATVEASLGASRWVKLNEHELFVLRGLLQLRRQTPAGTLRDLRLRYGIELTCLTRGERGCLVQTDDEEIAVAGLPADVVDTVGAGDAFTAGLMVATLEGRPLADAAVFANRLAARVAASAGGTPVIDRRELEG
jgi:fructokinase